MCRYQDFRALAADKILPALLIGTALIYLALKSVLMVHPPNDYQFIWLAGYMWGHGMNPYSALYGDLGETMFAGYYVPQVWFYPPSWMPIAMLTSQTSFETGIVIWRGISALCIIAGIWIVARACRRHAGPVSNLRVAGAFFFACFLSGTPSAMAIGQTTFIVFFGLALFIAAALGKNRVMMIPALYLLMLKPQIGLPFCLFLLMWRFWWPSLLIAGAVSVAVSLPAILISGPAEFLTAYMDGFAFHETMNPNHPRAMTGLRNLAWDVWGLPLPPLTLTLACTAAAILLAGLYLRRGAGDPPVLTALLALVATITALHTYDMVILSLLILLAPPLIPTTTAVAFTGLALIFRANNLAQVTGFYDHTTTHFVGSRIATIGLLVLLAGGLASLATAQQPARAAQ